LKQTVAHLKERVMMSANHNPMEDQEA